MGRRLANGRVAWFVSYPKPAVGGAVAQPTSEEQLRDIAAAVAKCTANTPAQPTGGLPAASASNMPVPPMGGMPAAPTSNLAELGANANPEPAVSPVPKPCMSDTNTPNATTRMSESQPQPPAVTRSIFIRLMKRCITVVQRTFSLFPRSFK